MAKYNPMDDSGNSSRAGRVAFSYPDFTFYQLARFFIIAGLEMQSVAVGWQIYEITKRPLDLGLVGKVANSSRDSVVPRSGYVRDLLRPEQTPGQLLHRVWSVLRFCRFSPLFGNLARFFPFMPWWSCSPRAAHSTTR